jgi:hypothetical protein
VPAPIVTTPMVAQPVYYNQQTPYPIAPPPQHAYPPNTMQQYPPQNAPYPYPYPQQQHNPYPQNNVPQQYQNAPYQHTTYPQNTTQYPPPTQNAPTAPPQQNAYPNTQTQNTGALYPQTQLPNQIVKRGWLTKEGEWVKSWKRRWFVLKDNTIYYFENETVIRNYHNLANDFRQLNLRALFY